METGENKMKAATEGRPLFERISAILQRPVLGPLLFGLVFGGGPAAVMFGILDSVSAWIGYCMLMVTPVAVVVSTIGAVQSANKRWKNLLLRSLLTSAATCIPTPTIVLDVLVWRLGYSRASIADDLAVSVYIFSIWAMAVTVMSWPLALIYVRFQNWRAQARHRLQDGASSQQGSA